MGGMKWAWISSMSPPLGLEQKNRMQLAIGCTSSRVAVNNSQLMLINFLCGLKSEGGGAKACKYS